MKKFLSLSVCAFALVLGTSASAFAVETPKPLQLLFGDQVYTLNFATNPELLGRTSSHTLELGDTRLPLDLDQGLPPVVENVRIQTEFDNVINRAALEAFFVRNTPLLNDETPPVYIGYDDSGNFSVTGFPKSGYYVDFDTLEILVNQAISYGYEHVRVPAQDGYSPVIPDQELIDRGITDVLAVGKSNFRGSSAARRQNIRVASDKYNGLILAPGEQFSFNGILKSVRPEDGYVEELVIKGNDTEKEYGGGICQVSTTVYRAAFNGGLQLDERFNHSYAVPYYQPHGFDATIYLGGKDFKFTNDTPADLIIQTLVSGDDMYFVFYGTDDGRKVVSEGPYISNHRPEPAPIIEETTVLPPGVQEYVSYGQDGFDTVWNRTVYKPGEAPLEETFASYYKAWPARIARGAGGRYQDIPVEVVEEVEPVAVTPEPAPAPELDPDFFSLENSTFAD